MIPTNIVGINLDKNRITFIIVILIKCLSKFSDKEILSSHLRVFFDLFSRFHLSDSSLSFA